MTIVFHSLFDRLRKDPLFRQGSLKTNWAIIGWWEKRRIVYNLVVGMVGLFSSLMILAAGILAEKMTGVPFGLCNPPIIMVLGILLYGFVANVCYTLGWVAQILSLKIWGKRVKTFGETSFTLGFMFSIVLTFGLGLMVSGIAFVFSFSTPHYF